MGSRAHLKGENSQNGAESGISVVKMRVYSAISGHLGSATIAILNSKFLILNELGN